MNLDLGYQVRGVHGTVGRYSLFYWRLIKRFIYYLQWKTQLHPNQGLRVLEKASHIQKKPLRYSKRSPAGIISRTSGRGTQLIIRQDGCCIFTSCSMMVQDVKVIKVRITQNSSALVLSPVKR